MKKFFIVSIIFAFVFTTSGFSQFGEISRKPQIEVFGGLAIPMAPDEFKDYFKMGYSIHGQYVMFPSSKLGISFGAAYEPFAFDGDKMMEDIQAMDPYTDYTGVGIDGSASILELGIGVRPYLTSPEATTQFFLFGMGTYNIIKTEISISYQGIDMGSESDETKKMGVAAGAGLEMPLTETMNMIIQGLYRIIFTEDENTTFLGVTAGLVF
ncbi:hypothetical protein ACX8XP_07820 [Calditrichota bacterium LG25]